MYCKENYHLSLIAQRLGGSAWLEFRDLPKLDYYLAYIKCAPPIQYVAFADENLYELLGICTSLRLCGKSLRFQGAKISAATRWRFLVGSVEKGRVKLKI